jgi:Flp pilus assembly pilin Flp
MLWRFVRDEEGQDLVEYTLLMAALTLACVGVVVAVGQQAGGIWSTVNSRLAAANTAATSTS